MDWLSLLFSCWEFYALAIPYLICGVGAYRLIGRRQHPNAWALLWTGILFWVIFLLGLFAIAMAAEIIIMFRHAEKVQ
jgi:hypothetical protein